jgi:hypothetical protein
MVPFSDYLLNHIINQSSEDISRMESDNPERLNPLDQFQTDNNGDFSNGSPEDYPFQLTEQQNELNDVPNDENENFKVESHLLMRISETHTFMNKARKIPISLNPIFHSIIQMMIY